MCYSLWYNASCRFLCCRKEMFQLYMSYRVKRNRTRQDGGVRGDWMELAQDRDGWQSLVGTVRNFRVP